MSTYAPGRVFTPGPRKRPRGAHPRVQTGAPGVSRVSLAASLKMLLRSDTSRVGAAPAPA